MSRPPKNCIYCKKVGQRSAEHIVANWVRKVIPRVETEHLKHHIPVNELGIQFSEMRTKRENRNVGAETILRVCQECNTGWMKSIQDNCIPIITPLLKGNWQEVTTESLQRLCQWATMTVINVDASHWDDSGVTQAERDYFFEHKRPPSNWYVWAGMVSGLNGITSRHRYGHLGSLESDGAVRITGKFQITTINIGQLLIHAASFPEGMVKLPILPYSLGLGILPLFPNQADYFFDWRTLPILRQTEVDFIANRLFLHLNSRRVKNA